MLWDEEGMVARTIHPVVRVERTAPLGDIDTPLTRPLARPLQWYSNRGPRD